MSPEATVVEQILLAYPRDPSSLIMVLQDLQAVLRHLPEAAIDVVSERLGVPRSQVYSAATFYKAFSLMCSQTMSTSRAPKSGRSRVARNRRPRTTFPDRMGRLAL